MDQVTESKVAARSRVFRPFRWRFGLRSLFVAVLIIGIPLGWFTSLVIRIRQQRSAVARVQNLGGQTIYDYNLNWDRRVGPPVPPGNRLIRAMIGDDVYARVAVVYFMKPVRDEDLKVLKDLPDLTGVTIYEGAIGGKGLEHLSAVEELDALNLGRSSVTTSDLRASPVGSRLKQLVLGGPTVLDETLVDLPELKRLEALQLFDAEVTDEGLRSVVRSAGLRSLSLTRCSQITDRGIGHLKDLKNLRHLGITGVPITEKSLAVLDELPQLEELHLWGLSLSDEAMAHLQGIKRMRNLMLRGCQISDVGVVCLANMQDLESLDLADSPITDAAIGTIAGFKKLQSLDLWTKNTTDASVPLLKSLTGLRRLVVGPGITRDAALEVAKALPTCHVSHVNSHDIVEDMP